MAESALRGWDAHVHVFDAAAPVRGGHYAPRTRPLGEIEARAAAHGVGHLVLVQPSVYGTDNGLLLRSLEASRGRHRGVAVVDEAVADPALDAMHALGVRAVRFNAVSPVGNGPAGVDALAPRLRERGWHAQWYVASRDLARLVPLQRSSGIPFVLDHLAGITAASGEADWEALAALASDGAWLKLSGWYRLDARPPYAELVPLIRRAAQMFEDRLVWGSDWPHTSLAAEPPYETLMQPLREALGDAQADAILRGRAARLYDSKETSP